jgi:uncharacterized protein YprB with RNaseH-like and TPR domain
VARSLLERLAALERSARQQASRPAADVDEEAAGVGNEADAPSQSSPLDDTAYRAATTPTPSTLTDLGFCLEDDGWGPFWHRELRYDLLAQHGHYRFGALLECDLSALSRLASEVDGAATVADREPLADDEDDNCGEAPTAAVLRFYDTETTGLGTGAGTFPFLHAVGCLEMDEWVVHQYFVADYTQEPALLRALLARHFTPGTVVVSYNGRTFDWPLFLNRLVMYRLPAPVGVRQLDLLHPSRRLWRKRLGRLNLASVEETVLGLERIDDLPGREAPSRYFAFVSDQNPGPLRPVFDHNAADVSSLQVLTAVIADLLSGRRAVDTAGEYTALARWYSEWREYDLAERCLVAAVACPDAEWQAFWLQGLLYKRQRRWQEAQAVWREMAERFPCAVAPLVELAKVAEHREHDDAAAAAWTRAALQRLETAAEDAEAASTQAGGMKAARETVRSELLHRLQRVERRLARNSQRLEASRVAKDQ